MQITLTLTNQNQILVDVDSIKKINKMKPNKYNINAQVVVSANGRISMHNVAETHEEIEKLIASINVKA